MFCGACISMCCFVVRCVFVVAWCVGCCMLYLLVFVVFGLNKCLLSVSLCMIVVCLIVNGYAVGIPLYAMYIVIMLVLLWSLFWLCLLFLGGGLT